MKTEKISLEFPIMVCADDYHTAPEFATTLSGIIKVRIKTKELKKLFDGTYYHVLYLDKAPSKEEIEKLKKTIYFL